MNKNKILIIEDDEDLRSQMKWGLAQDYEVLLAGDRGSALTLFREEQPAIVTLDLGLPPQPAGVEEGFRTLEAMLEADPLAKIVVITARNEKAHALEAISQGAYDFLNKPVVFDELKVILKRALYLAGIERENRRLQERSAAAGFEGMLGSSPQMTAVFEIIRRVAGSDIPVLVMGESGTGKELAARAIHARSDRRDGPFVTINCGAIPENLLESELFGHEKGAFTGAHTQRPGRIEKARGGTLFLDEIGEMPILLQTKLLRYLQEQTIERVGGREEIHVDARVLAATNVDLKEALEKGRFREDLYYRLAVVVISMPSLRNRVGDIPLLAKAFLKRFSKKNDARATNFSPQALRAMERHAWPGNIRELENRIKRGVVMTDGPKITPTDLELTSPFAIYDGQGLKEAREALERDFITRAMTRHGGNLTKTAEALGISRPSLYDLMGKLGIEKKVKGER